MGADASCFSTKAKNPDELKKRHDKMFQDEANVEKGVPSIKAKKKGNALYKEGKYEEAV